MLIGQQPIIDSHSVNAEVFSNFGGRDIRDEPNGRKSVGAWLLEAHLR